MGEGWHNNHHHYQRSCAQGFFWWEIDLTYYVLKALSLVGVVWDIQTPPEKVRDGSARPHVPVAPASARAVAMTFP